MLEGAESPVALPTAGETRERTRQAGGVASTVTASLPPRRRLTVAALLPLARAPAVERRRFTRASPKPARTDSGHLGIDDDDARRDRHGLLLIAADHRVRHPQMLTHLLQGEPGEAARLAQPIAHRPRRRSRCAVCGRHRRTVTGSAVPSNAGWRPTAGLDSSAWAFPPQPLAANSTQAEGRGAS